MKTTEQNSFGAEKAIEELIADNVKLLDLALMRSSSMHLTYVVTDAKLDNNAWG